MGLVRTKYTVTSYGKFHKAFNFKYDTYFLIYARNRCCFFVDHYNIGIYVGMASYCDPHVYCNSVKSGTCYTLNKNMFDIHLLFLHVHLKLGFSYKMTRYFYLKNTLCN